MKMHIYLHIITIELRNLLQKFRSISSKEERTLHQRTFNQFTTPKLRLWLLFLIIIFCSLSGWVIRANAQHSAELQTEIAQEIIRFHVIANSDSTEDQALKLVVKDNLVKSLSPLLDDASTINEARSILLEQQALIQETAEDTIQARGYDYSVKVSLEKCYFPMKVYGDYSFPPGTYEALRVQIGAAKGKNWWCVMFPPLCFVDETYSIVDEKSGKKLKKLLSDEEYATLFNKKTPVKVKFKILESLKKLFR